MKNSIIGLSIFLSLCGCEQYPDAQDLFLVCNAKAAVINGAPTQHSEFPSVTAIMRSGIPTPICTGAFIAPNIVLTASHCVDEYDTDEFQVLYQKNYACSASEDEDRINVLVKIEHPETDMALLMLEETPNNVQYIDILPEDQFDEALTRGKEIRIIGYGRYNFDMKGVFLMSGTSTISDVTDESLITSDQGATVCYGDSGGPAYINHNNVTYTTGVLSKMAAEKECTGWAKYVLPGVYMDWINNSIQLMEEAVAKGCNGCPIEEDNVICEMNQDIFDCDNGCNISEVGINKGIQNILLMFLFFLFILRRKNFPILSKMGGGVGT